MIICCNAGIDGTLFTAHYQSRHYQSRTVRYEDGFMITANQVADWFIERANADEEYGENITNLKLQKLLYYAQGACLGLYHERLFDDSILAWAHGPVVRVVYDRFKFLGAAPIPNQESFNPDQYDERVSDLLEQVYAVYGQFSAWGLRNLTHQEDPWIQTKQSQTIPFEAIREYFELNLVVA